MASRPKQDGGVKEKRGKSPSNLRHTTDPAHRSRTSPHPPPATADHQKPNSTNVPNYLRPTASSRSDASKSSSSSSSSTPKKPSLNITVENTAQKANIHRRRSLDNKPPSTSQLFKSQPTSSDNKPNSTHHSPTSNIVKPKPASAFTKPLPEKVAKAFSKDAGKSNPLYSRPVKTIKKNIPNSTAGNSAATKKQKSAGGNASATKSRHTIDKEAKQEPVQEDGDHESLVAEYEDIDRGTNPVEDKDHLDDAQHNEGESDHQSEDIEESDEEVKKLPDPFMACEEHKTATASVSEEPNGAAAAAEKEDIEPEELHIDGAQIEDKVEEDDRQKNAHENHPHHQQKESFESESLDGIENVEKWKSGETDEHSIDNVVDKEEADGEGNTENKSEHETREDEVESEEKKVNTKVKEEEAEVNKAEVEVKEEKPEVKEETTEVKERNPEVKDQKTYIEERKPDVKKDKAAVEEEKSEVKEENPEVREEEPEEKEKGKQRPEQFEEKPKAKEEKQLNEGVKEEKSQVKGEDLMQKKTVWRTTSGQLGNNKDNNSSNSNSNAYNNVIEETASKLKEQRKNKVLALVGAFETVISLEDPDSETPRGN